MRKWHGNPWAILLTLSLGFFMTLLDLTIVNIAIPSMINKLNASLDEVLWVVNAYVLVLAALLITAGRLGDLRGQRTLFILGVAVFTLASLLCGISQNPVQLISARVVQGLGAAMLMPQTMAIIIATFPPERRGAALGVWGAVAGVATITGPTLGGFLVTAFDWRWIFFVNLPFGLIVLFLAFTVIPYVRQERRHRLDLPGVLIATAGLFCLTFALTEGQRYDWNGWIMGLFSAAAALFAVFLLQQRSRQDREPLVPFGLFRDRNFTVMNFVGATVSIGMIGMFLPLGIYMQSVLGYTAFKAGLVMVPLSVVSMLIAPFSGRLSDRIGGKYILMTGLAVYGLGSAWLIAVSEADTKWPTLIAPMIVSGAGVGCVFAPMATEAMRGVDPRLAGAASGVNNTIRQMGSVIGSAAVGAILQSRLAVTLPHEAVKRSGRLPAQAREQFVNSFRTAAKGRLEVGAGQSGAAGPPHGLPAQLAEQMKRTAEAVFTHGFVNAMKPTIAVPIAVLLVGAASCLLVRGHPDRAGRRTREPVEAATR